MDDMKFDANLGYFLLCFFCNITIVSQFFHCWIISIHLFSFLCSLFVPYAYVSVESMDCVLLSSLAINLILLTPSINTLCFSLLNLCCDFNINQLFFEFFMIFSVLTHFHVDLLKDKFYSLQI